jgi:hypothetical protein
VIDNRKVKITNIGHDRIITRSNMVDLVEVDWSVCIIMIVLLILEAGLMDTVIAGHSGSPRPNYSRECELYMEL